MDWSARFDAFVEKKTAAAREAHIPGYVTVESHQASVHLGAIGNAWTMARFDGRFFESWPRDRSLPAINCVFVQSADGNTGADQPITLGGGLTDKHLIYEGLSSVHADAILTGATTIRGEHTVMALWHPELVALRTSLGLPRYPAQVVATRSGQLDIDTSLLYNLPHLRVFIITGDAGADAMRPHTDARPWIQVLNGGESSDLIGGLKALRAHHGIARVSSIAGRTVATQLIDASVVQDLYLTTSPQPGGQPNTPFYTGPRPPATSLVVRKAGQDIETGVIFEHLRLSPPNS